MRTTRVIAGAAIALTLAVTASAHADGIDGPGRYYVFRTLDSGEAPTDEQTRRCSEHFGPRTPTAVARAHALLFSFRTDPTTARAVDQTAGFLGRGFICSAPSPGSRTGFEAFAYTTVPESGEAEAHGPCSLAPVLVQPGALFFNCALALRPDEALGLLGGVASSNSIVNPGNVAPGTPSGSLWTAYVVSHPGAAAPPSAPPPAQPPEVPETRGLDFYVLRSFGDAVDAAGCRRASLSSTAPDLRTGSLATDELLYPDAGANLCLSGDQATATVTLQRGGRTVELAADGSCSEEKTPAGLELRQQTCGLTVRGAPGVRGGLVTATGLVRDGAAANSHVWTVALLADPVADPVDGEPPRAALILPRRAARGRVPVSWSAADEGSQVRDYTLALRTAGRGGRWRTVEESTVRESATLRLRRERRYLVRVRATDRAGNASAWVTRSTRVAAAR